MAGRSAGGRARAVRHVAASVFGAAAVLSPGFAFDEVRVATGATTRLGHAGGTSPVRTLVTTPHKIRAFAQDSGRIAWITALRVPPRRAGCGLWIRSLATGRTATTRLNRGNCRGVEGLGDLALASRTAAWVESYTCGNTECSWRTATATAGDRRERVIHTVVDVRCNSGACSYLTHAAPLLAGADRLLVYYNGQGPLGRGRVERIVAGRARRAFTAGDVYSLAVGGGRMATASVSLAQGDGCGCLGVPAWSPDGTKIAYLAGAFSRYNGGVGAALAVMNADGSDRHNITSSHFYGGGPPLSLSWSPDGTKIVYDGGTSRNGNQLGVVNADGSGASTLLQGYSPAWSPDGSQIAFIRIDYTNHNGGIFVTDPAGSYTRELTSGSTGLGELAWSPDGTRIAFSLDGVLELMNADGSNVHQLGVNTAGDEPAWSPDSHEIVFRDAAGLSVIGADGSGLRRLTSGPDEQPSWSPDGKTIVFASDRDDAYANYSFYNDREFLELYLVDPNGSNLRPLSFTQQSTWVNDVVVRAASGRRVSTLPGFPPLPRNRTGATSTALVGPVAAVSGVTAGGADEITLSDARNGKRLATVQVGLSPASFSVVGGDARWIVFQLGREISALGIHSHRIVSLARTRRNPIGLSVSGRRVAWAENTGERGHIRGVQLPS